ncbi:ribose-phosphate diphosphokinase, partial [Candidatus Pacearchaeota archaeon]|nr:ribose-phosphate diphosphokinase [Candidatus Pacearchaeota archaeon]
MNSVHKCTLLANPQGYGWQYALGIHNDVTWNPDDHEQFTLSRINISPPNYKFRDGEIKPKIIGSVRKRNCYFIHDSSLDPNEWFTQMCMINASLKKTSAQEIIDVFPYLKFSRGDKKDESGVPIAAKVVADVIGLYADRLMTIDFHNQAINGFYDIPVDNLSSHRTVADYLKKNHPQFLENLVVVSTDLGGAKEARNFGKFVDCYGIAIGDKSRKSAGVVGEHQIVG